MKKLIKIIVLLVIYVINVSCQQQSLQKYIVEKSDNSEFKSFTFSPKDFQEKGQIVEKFDLLDVVKNVNVLIYNKTDSLKFEVEKQEIQSILSDRKYQNLFRFNQGNAKFQIDYVGSDSDIEEIVVFGIEKQRKLFLLRVLTDKLTTEQLTDMATTFQQTIVGKNFLNLF